MVQEDISRTKSWSLASHGGFYTPPHRDSNGLCTAATVTSGLKIWGFISHLDGPMTMKDRKDWDKGVFVDSDRPMHASRRCIVTLPPQATM